jgi:hypothetical protein
LARVLTLPLWTIKNDHKAQKTKSRKNGDFNRHPNDIRHSSRHVRRLILASICRHNTAWHDGLLRHDNLSLDHFRTTDYRQFMD